MTTTDFYVLAAPLQSDQELREEPRRIAIKRAKRSRTAGE
jgi:hypothetical protein